MTEFYISTETITEATGRSVCAGASSSLLTRGVRGAPRERWTGIWEVQERRRADVPAELSADTSGFTVESGFAKKDLSTV